MITSLQSVVCAMNISNHHYAFGVLPSLHEMAEMIEESKNLSSGVEIAETLGQRGASLKTDESMDAINVHHNHQRRSSDLPAQSFHDLTPEDADL